MNIWGWTYEVSRELYGSGETRLADVFHDLPRDCNANRHAQVEARVPEALASARALNLPWVELFVRHWHLQSRVARRREGETAMGEAVALLEFAHREETTDCPQSVCAVQDFVICHGATDGPGYAPERIAVLKETLARIDPTWSCYDCLTSEYADALLDDGKVAQALSFVRAQRARIRAAGGSVQAIRVIQEAGLLYRLGRFDEALAGLDRADLTADEDDRIDQRSWRALVLAAKGCVEAAVEALPAPELLDSRPSYQQTWAEAALTLAEAGALTNDWRLGRRLTEWVTTVARGRAHWHHLELALTAGQLAAGRGARWVAGQLLDQVESALGRLKRPELATERVEALRSAVAALAPVTLPTAPAELIDHLQADERPDLEVHADLLVAAVAAAPDDDELVNVLAQAMAVLGFPGKAAELLDARVEREPGGETALHLIQVLLEAGDDEALERLAARLEGTNPAVGRWALARLHAARERWREAAAACEAVVALDDGAVGARGLLARALRELGDFDGARAREEEALARAGADHPLRRDLLWGLAIDATGSGDWAAVRRAAAEIGMPVELGDEPIDEPWGLIRVEFADAGGRRSERVALRTGPATARIVSVARPGDAHNYGDVVLFFPEAIESPPPAHDPEHHHDHEGDHEGDDGAEAGAGVGAGDAESPPPSQAPLLFPAITTLEQGGYLSFLLDGAFPGETRWHAFADALRARGYGIWAYSGDDYVLYPDWTMPGPDDDGDGGGRDGGDADRDVAGHGDGDPKCPEELPGVYAGLAVPPGTKPDQAIRLLDELTADWPHPLSWLDLAEAAGVGVKRQRGIVARFGL